MWIKPKNPDSKIVDPEQRDFLPSSGRNVSDSEYWQRLLRDEDIEECEEPPQVVTPLE